jgi:hypothetical protein
MTETFMGLKGRSCGMEVGDWRIKNYKSYWPLALKAA